MTDTFVYRPLSGAAAAALQSFANAHGPGWKNVLCDAWADSTEMDDDTHGIELRLIRNRYGPSWLLDTYAYGWTPELPAWEPLETLEDGEIAPSKGLPRWGGVDAPPAVGAEVEANFNNLGRAVVTGYFTESEFLGLIVRFVDPPAFLTNQNRGDVMGHLFGAEIYSQAEHATRAGGYRFRRRADFFEGRFEINAFSGAPSLTPDEIAARHEAIKAALIVRATQYAGPWVVFDPSADEDGWLLVGPRAEIAAETAQMIADTRD
ncbi:hypothetical protein GURKE_05150 [Brevundimonas phage vB_BpoS-Gurke]|uniref:Uncharacterized protein n=1 Tax=Brevundimonas phage vB_BpoS-Gurke TaxID=2948599 RepID=A0A9E7N4S7_9CAUD|nr:hypothetical protein GURKE_05150 [Brevundimonas phage vB_BpoS-Gurke]